MEAEQYDLIVIGGGGAANELATRAHRDFGARVVAIESGRWGGICSTTACKPTKQYLAAAELIHHLRVALGARHRRRRSPRSTCRGCARARTRRSAATRSGASGSPTRASTWSTGGLGSSTRGRSRSPAGGSPAARIAIATGSLQAVPPIRGDRRRAVDRPCRARSSSSACPPRWRCSAAGPSASSSRRSSPASAPRVTLVQRPDRIADRARPRASAALHEALVAEGIDDPRRHGRPRRARRTASGVELTLDPRDGGDADDDRGRDACSSPPAGGRTSRGSRSRRPGVATRPARDRGRRPHAHGGRRHLGDRRRHRDDAADARSATTRRGSRSRTCSRARPGRPSTSSCRPRSSPIPSSPGSG